MSGRGGRNQRENREGATNAVHNSELAKFLILQCLWGHCSIPYVQKIAKMAMRDIENAIARGGCFSYRDLEALSALGPSGIHVNNMRNDLMRNLAPSQFHTFNATLPMKVHERRVRPYLQSFLLPHETFSVLYHSYPDTFRTRVLSERFDAVQNFGKRWTTTLL